MSDDNIKKAVTFLTKNGYVVNPPESVFIVQITLEEVKALRFLLEHVGGPPTGPRGQIDSFSVKLQKTGVKIPAYRLNEHTGSIYFANKQPTMVDAITEDDDFE